MSKTKSKQTDEPELVVYQDPKLLKNLNRRSSFLVLGCLVVLIIIVGVAYLHQRSNKSNKVVIGTECSSSTMAKTMEETNNLLNGSNVTQLKQIVTKIQAIKSYQQDPNCLYPVVAYYIDTSDAANANLYLSKLEKVYSVTTGYNQYISSNTKSISELKNDISTISQNANLTKSNFVTTGAKK